MLLNQARRPNVVAAGDGAKEKLVLLNPEHVPALDSVPADCQKFAQDKGGIFVVHSVVTSYDQYTFDEALRKLLPEGVDGGCVCERRPGQASFWAPA